MIESRRARWSMALCLPALLMLAHGAAAQTAAPAAPAAAQSAGSVLIRGMRGAPGGAHEIIAAQSKVMSRNYASSCALFAAGRMVDFGESVAADHKRAAVYYKEAAVKGDRDAQFALGTFFYTGDAVPQDFAVARKLFGAAARQGQADAMFNLGAMETNGEGGPRNLAMAYVWFSLAKAAGHRSAEDALKAVAPKLTAQDHAKVDAILKPPAKKS